MVHTGDAADDDETDGGDSDVGGEGGFGDGEAVTAALAIMLAVADGTLPWLLAQRGWPSGTEKPDPKTRRVHSGVATLAPATVLYAN